MPKVSVIIPVYNVEKYLGRCLNTVLGQTLKDIEIICINDCSLDNSLKILQEYAQKDSRLTVINLEDNKGAAYARNRGLEIAKSEYLGFIDPDDYIDLDYYECLYNKAIQDNADIVKCGRKTIQVNGTITTSNLNDRVKKDKYNFLYEWTTAIYKSALVFDNNIIFPEKCRKAQDVVFLNRCLLKSEKISFVDDVYYYYCKRKNSLHSKIIPIKNIKSALSAISLILRDINNSELYESNPEQYINYYASILNIILETTLFQNNTLMCKKLCAETLINNFYKCKNIDWLSRNFKYKWMLQYIVNKKYNKLSLLFWKCHNKKYLNCKPKTFIQNIFSITNSPDRRFKRIIFLGFEINIKRRYQCQR